MDASPLVEFVSRSCARKQCTKDGVATGFPTPWAFTLATQGKTGDLPPSIRNVGVHSVDATGWLFTCRGAPGGAAGGALPGNDIKSGGEGENAAGGPIVASLCYLAGNFPKAGFEEQWRAEGIIEEVDVASLSTIAPPDPDLQVQIVASAAFAEQRVVTTGSTAPYDQSGRLLLTETDDDKKLDRGVTSTKQRQKAGTLPVGEILEAGFRAYRLVPWRVEILEGGPAWPQGPMRHEWRKVEGDQGAWQGPVRILPYNVPPPEPKPPTAAAAAATNATGTVANSRPAAAVLVDINNVPAVKVRQQWIELKREGEQRAIWSRWLQHISERRGRSRTEIMLWVYAGVVTILCWLLIAQLYACSLVCKKEYR